MAAYPLYRGKRNAFQEPSRRRVRQGFTLVEMVIALGLAGFALTSLLGLLPCGLQNFRKAMDFTLQTQMVQNLVGKASHMAFGDLSQLAAQPYYFDDNGNMVDAEDITGTYKANVSVTGTIALPSNPGFSNPGVAQLTITYTRKQAAASTPPTGTVVTYIAAMTGSVNQ
ncbi:MAG: Verru_Chthon cassette protein B [Chthoniobacteraceae bacterium]|nr:Verru_Chthon cassette protein B [Chthoniobacteraceae bacterium]